MNSLETLSTLMLNNDTADVDLIEVHYEVTTEGWAALARSLSKASVHMRSLLTTTELEREGREEDLDIIYDKCNVNPFL